MVATVVLVAHAALFFGAPPAIAKQVSGLHSPASTARAPRAATRKKEPRNAPVELFHVNSKESLQLRLLDEKGRRVKNMPKRFQHFLRCHYTHKDHKMDPRLMALVYKTGRHFVGHRLEVVSGFRDPSMAKNPRSPHMKGLACDFRVAGVPNTTLRDYLRKTFEKIGVGYYPNSSFVHLDVRKDKSAFWIDYSGPGERSVYSEDAAGDLKSGRAETYRPAKISPAWADTPPSDPFGDDSEPPPSSPPAPPATTD